MKMIMNEEQLRALFTHQIESIVSGDSMEGNISYEYRGHDAQRKPFWDVWGVVRTGNCEGQGGMSIFERTPHPGHYLGGESQG
jgi:hypothetical protein